MMSSGRLFFVQSALAILIASFHCCQSRAVSPLLSDPNEDVRFTGIRGAHRRLDDETNTTDCPQDSIYYCNDPSRITGEDDSVQCDPDTCRWILGALDPSTRPRVCNGITIDAEDADTVADFLEPCLWWEMIYGDFQPTTMPSVTPSPFVSPSSLITSEPSVAPLMVTVEPTVAPSVMLVTAQPTENSEFVNENTTDGESNTIDTNSEVPSTLNETVTNNQNETVTSPQDDAVNVEDGDQDPAQVDDTGSMVPFDTFLLTMLTRKVPQGRLRRLQQESMTFDRSELLLLIEEHLQTELTAMLLVEQKTNSSSTADGARIQAVTLSVSGVRYDNRPPVWSTTEAIRGHVIFDRLVDEDQTKSVPKMVAKALRGLALKRLLRRMQTARDPLLRSTVQLYVGVSPAIQAEFDDDIFNVDAARSNEDNAASSNPMIPFEWNVFWIAIIAIAGAGLLGCLLGAYLYCRIKSKRRLDRERDIIPSKTSQTGDDDSSGDVAEKGVAGFGSQRSSPLASTAVKKLAVIESDDEDEQSQAGRYPVSEATSCYSYIESNSMMGDQSYSVAPSLMYGNYLPGDDDDDENQTVESRMWSVADGIGPDASVLAADMSYQAPPLSIDARNHIVIFSDDNDEDDYDDLSLVSEKARDPVPDVDIRRATALVRSKKESDVRSGSSRTVGDQKHKNDRTHMSYTSALPLVEEMSRHSEGENSMSTEDLSILTPRARGSRPDVNESTTSSMIAPDYPAESSDDDSSLFMGPGITNTVALAMENKVTSIPSFGSKREFVEADEDSDEDIDDSFSFPTPYSPKKDIVHAAGRAGAASPAGTNYLMSMASF